MEISKVVEMLGSCVPKLRLGSRMPSGRKGRWRAGRVLSFLPGTCETVKRRVFHRARAFPCTVNGPIEMGLDSSYMAR